MVNSNNIQKWPKSLEIKERITLFNNPLFRAIDKDIN